MNNFDKCLDILAKIENRSFRGKNRVVVTVEDIAELTDLFEHLNDEDRKNLQEFVSEKISSILIGFTLSMAEKAINTREKKWIKRIYITHIIENFEYDYRENIRQLIFLDYAAQRIGGSKMEAWDHIKELCSPKALKHLTPQQNLENTTIRLERYGFTETHDEGLIRIKKLK